MKLNLGVIDIPYTNETTAVSTGQVATWLENEYHIMETFAELHEEQIADALADALEDSVDNMMMGAPLPDDPFMPAHGRIEHMFKVFLDEEQMATFGGHTGIPTFAALMGISHRKGAKRGERRPSFIDTGLYQTSFKTWSG